VTLRVVATLAGLLGLWTCTPGNGPTSHEGHVPLANGGRLYYRVTGAGPDTVVVLHGGPGLHGRYLDQALAGLSRDHVLIAYDQRGRGRSDFPRDSLALSAATDVEDLDAVRAFFRLDSLTLIGHGWGAGLGALYAMRFPTRVARVLMISPMVPRAQYLWNLTFQRAAGRDTSGLDGLMAARRAGMDRTDPLRFCRRYWGALLSPAVVRDRMVLQRLSRGVCDTPPSALEHVELVNRRITGSLGAWSWPEQLGPVRIPVLVMQGAAQRASERDEGSTWLAAARDWVASLPNARLVLVGTTPQFPWIDAGSQFTEPARQFLAGGWPAHAQVASRADSSRASSDARD
jgi:proline iminopeptidase